MNKIDSNNDEFINKIFVNDNFDELFEYASEKKYLKYINKFAIESLTLDKLKNFIIACYEEDKKKVHLVSKPYKFIIDPINACNLKCPLCPTGLGESSRVKKVMKLDFFYNLIDNIKDYCIEVHLYNWGEPTLNKNLIEMIDYCSKNQIWTRISSNLSLEFKEGYLEKLIHSGLSLLHIDLDGLDQDVYKKYRVKGDYNLVMKNLSEIVKIKKESKLKKPILELAMLAMSQNEHQLDEFLSKKDEFGVDVIKVDKIQHNPNMDEKWLPKNKELIYSTYEGGKSNSHAATSKNPSPCHWPWSGIVINPEGSVSPCCLVEDQNSDFGNINFVNVEDIWNNDFYISSRSEFGTKKDIRKNTICNICKNETHSTRLNRVSKSFAIKM